jgi:ribosomal protein S18 acetylase RimI-like enzyme
VIRPPRGEETAHLVALGESTGIFEPGEADALLRATLAAHHASQLAPGHDVRVWAHPADDRALGWTYYGPSSRGEWEVFWIGVAPANHGLGVGVALLAFVEDHVLRAGGKLLFIETSSAAPLARARKFYQHQGYAVVDVARGFYGESIDRVTFAKTLGRGAPDRLAGKQS